MNPITISYGLTGIVFLIAGYLLKKKPHKKINGIYGYRSSKSMQSQKAWDAAQLYSAKMMMQLGTILVILGLPFLFFTLTENMYLVHVGLFLVILIALVFYMFYKTEKYIDDQIK